MAWWNRLFLSQPCNYRQFEIKLLVHSTLANVQQMISPGLENVLQWSSQTTPSFQTCLATHRGGGKTWVSKSSRSSHYLIFLPPRLLGSNKYMVHFRWSTADPGGRNPWLTRRCLGLCQSWASAQGRAQEQNKQTEQGRRKPASRPAGPPHSTLRITSLQGMKKALNPGGVNPECRSVFWKAEPLRSTSKQALRARDIFLKKSTLSNFLLSLKFDRTPDRFFSFAKHAKKEFMKPYTICLRLLSSLR